MFKQNFFIATALSSLILLISLLYLGKRYTLVKSCTGQYCQLANTGASDVWHDQTSRTIQKSKTTLDSAPLLPSSAASVNDSKLLDQTALEKKSSSQLPASKTSLSNSATSSKPPLTPQDAKRDNSSVNLLAQKNPLPDVLSKATTTTHPPNPPKPLILFYHRISSNPLWWFTGTEKDFSHCPNQCRVTGDISLFSKADLVLFQTPRFMSKEGDKIKLKYFVTDGIWPTERGNPGQVRMFYAREPETSVLSGEGLSFARYMFNYTITFQQKADIFYPYGHTIKQPSALQTSEVMKYKKRLIFWMVSNCGSRKRMEYKAELEKYVQVDMIGRCNKTHGDPCDRVYSCIMALKRQYKFYLAFENSMCQEYITEKFWKALNEGMVPIVMGAPKKTYESVGPPNSFIHVDDFLSPQHLSKYLLELDANDDLYRKYHKWRETHAIQYNSANCDICRFATEKPPKVTDITQAWDAKTQCIWP